MSQQASTALAQWTTHNIVRDDVTDAWQAALGDNYRSWQVTQAVEPTFEASIRNRDISGMRVVECVCDPCSGRRISQHISRDGESFIGVQVTKAGRERFHFGGETINVGPGDLVIWTSATPTEFTVTERLHKVSLVLPWLDIQERLPKGTRFDGTVIDSRNGIGAVLFSHMDSLSRQMDILAPADHSAIRRATLELLVAAMSYRVDAPAMGLAKSYLKRLQDYILAHLQDEDLSIAAIAEANHMSVRYVHMLFAQIDQSASTWIRHQRLERCREDLCSGLFRERSVAEIAYRWGFNDPAHFSRVFKERYGTNPSQSRQAKDGTR